MSQGINLNFGFSREGQTQEKEVKVLNIALLVDFGQEPFTSPKAISWEKLDTAIAELCPRLSLNIEGQQIDIPLTELESFHPDEIYKNSSVFATLRDLKQRLKNPATFTAAVAQLGAVEKVKTTNTEKATETTATTQVAENSLLEGLLGGKVEQEQPAVAHEAQSTAENFISSIVAPYIIQDTDPQLGLYLQVVDMTMVGIMKRILHHQDFQRVESLWRSVDMLLRRIEDEVAVKVHLVQADAESIQSGAIASTLLESYPNNWDILLADFVVQGQEAELQWLQAANQLAAKMGARFLVAVAVPPSALDKSTDEIDFFAAVKKLPAIELYGPGFLLRYPYGEKTDEIDSYPFEEWDNNFEHTDYLWANGAFAAAILAIDHFQSGGRSRPVLSGLPVHVINSEVTPPAQMWLSDRQVEKLQGMGISPLVSIRGKDSIEVFRGLKV